MARTRVLTRSRGARPGGTWARITIGSFAVAGNTKVLAATGVLSNPGIGETIRRTRGIIGWRSDQTAVDEDQIGAFGAIVVSDLAIAAGVASIPGPDTDASDDGWFVWQPLLSGFEFQSGTGVIFRTFQIFEFDSKAMRRVEEGFSQAFVVENGSANGATCAFLLSQYGTRN